MKNFRKILIKSINETLEEKSEMLMKKIKKAEMEEGRDSFDIEGDYNSEEFEPLSTRHFKDIDDEGGETPDYHRYKKGLKDIFKDIKGSGEDIEPISEGEMCECGGMMKEGECMECGSMREEFNEEEEEKNVFTSDIQLCEFNRKHFGEDDEETIKACKNVKNINERLYGKQRKIDRNKNKRIDSEDLRLLRKSKKHKSEVEEDEMEEGNKFTGMLAKARKGDKFSMNGKTYTDTSNYDVNEGIEYHIQDKFGDVIKLNENEIIDLIENIVLEEKEKGLKSMTKPVGLATYEKAHKTSGKENIDNMKSVSTKMKDYLKDGSKGKYDTNPKFFPKGNGQLADMKKKAFQITDELEDFNYQIAGQNFPSPNEIGYDEKRMEKYFKGDSTTGNAPGGNALESEANERFNKMRKKNTLKKLKDQSYKRVSQPVFNETNTDEDGKLNIKLETMSERKVNILKEEFERMKDLFKYNRKTQ